MNQKIFGVKNINAAPGELCIALMWSKIAILASVFCPVFACLTIILKFIVRNYKCNMNNIHVLLYPFRNNVIFSLFQFPGPLTFPNIMCNCHYQIKFLAMIIRTRSRPRKMTDRRKMKVIFSSLVFPFFYLIFIGIKKNGVKANNIFEWKSFILTF